MASTSAPAAVAAHPRPSIDHMDDAELLAHLIRVLRHPSPDSVLEAIERAIEGPTAH